MTANEARQYRADRADCARAHTRQTKAKLEQIARNRGSLFFGKPSKDELVTLLVNARYPLEQENEAIHVLHHKPGEAWSACEHCARAVAAAMDVLA